MSAVQVARALLEARNAKVAPRWRRIVRQPIKSVRPALLSLMKRTVDVDALTFWDEHISVVVPEPVSSSIYRFGFFDHSVCRFLLAALKPGDTYVDVGAHIGFFALLAAWKAGPNARLVCFEPMPATRAKLIANLASHGLLPRADVLDVAAFDKECIIDFQDFGIANSSYNSAFQGRGMSGRHATSVQVCARRCDDVFSEIGLRRLDVMKIDAESSELSVLKGAGGAIAKFRPILVVELGDFDLPGVPKSREIVDWLLARGYAAYEVTHDDDLRYHDPLDRYEYTNIMFVPVEKVDHFDAQIDR